MPAMAPKPPTTPKKSGSAGSSRGASAKAAAAATTPSSKPQSVRAGSARKSTKKSKAKVKAVDADGKKVVDTSWKAKVTINLYNTHYPVLRDVVKDLGFTIAKDSDMDAFLIWYNSAPPIEVIKGIRNYQKINHFPASSEISRKDSLARNLAKMQPYFPSEFNFFPKSWILPAEYGQFKSYADQHRAKGRPKTFIYKPTNSAQGKGIALTRNPKDVSSHDTMLVQEYLARPFLIDNFKFDLRIYILVTSVDPLRVFMYEDGLVRLSTVEYKAPTEQNMDQLYMHLTNYSVNKNSEDFGDDDDAGSGSKRTIKWMMEWLQENGHDTERLWERMADVMLKTLMVALPQNVHEYRVSRRVPANAHNTAETASQCFAIYGFDIFLDKKLNPYVIEVNRSPSFACDAPLDREIKYGVLSQAFKLLKLRPSEKVKAETQTRKQAQGRLFGPAAKAVVAAAKLKRATSKTGSSGRDGWITSSGGAVATTEAADRAAAAAAFAARAEEEAAAHVKSRQESANAIKLEEEEREAEAARCAYEAKHLGMYRRIYPLKDPTSERAQIYQQIIDESTQTYFKSGGTGSKVPRSKMPREATFAAPAGPGGDAVRDAANAAAAAPFATDGGVASAGAGAAGGSPSRPSSGQLRTGSGTPIPPISKKGGGGGSGGSGSGSGSAGGSARKHYRSSLNPNSDRSSSGGGSSGSGGGGGGDDGGDGMGGDDDERSGWKARPLGGARSVENASGPECQSFLASLRGMRIACPGHTDEETLELIRQVRGAWVNHDKAVGQYWLQTLDRRRRVDIIKIVQSNVMCIIGTFWPTSVSGRIRVVQVINRMFDRLTWHNGHNLFKTFSTTLAHSLDGLINITHTSVLEQQCCHRVVELCQDCLLVVYLCSRQITLQMNEDGTTSTNLGGLAETQPAPAHRGPALTTLAFD